VNILLTSEPEDHETATMERGTNRDRSCVRLAVAKRKGPEKKSHATSSNDQAIRSPHILTSNRSTTHGKTPLVPSTAGSNGITAGFLIALNRLWAPG